MDTSPQAGSSNVTVEYTDPSGVFPLVQPVFENKLPLKNLHWKSPSRPVRSIESLRIGFAQQEAVERKSSSDTVSSPVPHRRHQIPGLRQTPYLKIYLLRCDDNDTYKATARKAVREWIKSHGTTPQASTSTTTTSNQEKHDAFEWLIVHVEQDGDGVDKAASTSKWGRGNTTVLEKIKADFNGTSKSAVDRVAQLRLPKPGTSQKPPELLYQIEDLVAKMKNAILASFDLRVAQYEEDIKEKDSQRSLPGWNFCTFFILKEGLARGFENVGLFEDALVGYDELSVGLDTAIHEQLQGSGDQHGSALSTYSKDWNEKARKALESRSTGSGGGDEGAGDLAPIPEIDSSDFPFDSAKKPYRDMILASDISIFDFRNYVFSRQLTLLLRASRAPSLVNKDSPQKGKKPEDLMLISEICERATEFIGLAARTLRYDLEHGLTDVDNATKTEVVNNLVSSWTYAAASQILSQTSTPTLTLPDSIRVIEKSLDTSSSPAAAAAAEIRPDVPKRSSSLVHTPAPRAPRPVSQDIFDVLAPVHTRAGSEAKPASALNPKTGSEQLASGRGELFLLSRRVLEEIAGRSGWKEKWNDLSLLFDSKGEGGDMAEVSLDDGHPGLTPEPKTASSLPSLCGIDLPGLKAALKSRQAFRAQYEELTDQMFRHHIAANRPYSAETAIADIALLRYRQADYSAAASHFHQIAPFYGNKHWILLEGAILEMYTRCLKELKRSEEYVRMLLRLLAKFAAHAQANLTGHEEKVLGTSSLLSLVSPYVNELFETSSALQKEVPASVTDFFADLRVDPAVLHYDDKDGFQVQLYLRFLLGKHIDVDAVKARLVSAGGSQSNEYWIETSSKAVVKSSSTRLLIDSSTTLQGKYFVDRIEVRAGNITFMLGSGKNSALPLGFREALDAGEEDNRPYIYCYPPPEALQAKIVSTHQVNLEEMRTLELEFNSGRNEIKTGTIRVRPASAGLRLRISEAELVEGEMTITANNESGNIEFTQFGSNSFVRFRIPYTVDENHTTLSARAEVGYETEQGRFSYSSVHSIVSSLPISVNVQDIFKDEVLFSRFTIGPAMQVPLRVLGCSIPSSDTYQVESNVRENVAWDVFPKQPASLLYKIQPRKDRIASLKAKGSLRLTVEFACVDDESLDVVEKTFRADVAGSEFRRHTSLLTSHIVETFRTQLSTAALEVIGLTREIETLPYENVRWESLLGALKGGPVDGLRAWLTKWHQTHPVISLPQQPSIPSRRIVIPVDIPEIQVVHTAELRLGNLVEQPTHAAVGQMIAAELRLRHTRRWCTPEHQEHAPSGSALEFSYELHANPDLWLVGGRRRGNFLAHEGETTTFAVMLLPQNPGHLLLPGLEIKAFMPVSSSTPVAVAPQPPPQSPAGTSAGAGSGNPGATPLQRRQIACEVDYRNHAETVLVLPDLRKTTVSLSVSGGNHGGGSWLVDSERRGHV